MVLRIINPGIRNAIENYTRAQTFPDVIVFVPDGNGDWITSTETIQDSKYNRPEHVTNVLNRLTSFGEPIEYVPPVT